VVEYENNYTGMLSGKLEPDTKLYITNYDREDIQQIKSFVFQVIYYRNGEYEPVQPFEEIVRINAVRFYKEGSFAENDYFETPALIREVINTSKTEQKGMNQE